MSELAVKRYTAHCTGLLLVPPEARATYNENWKDVVLASDFDRLVAELDALAKELSAIRDPLVVARDKAWLRKITDERDSLQARLLGHIEALRKQDDRLCDLLAEVTRTLAAAGIRLPIVQDALALVKAALGAQGREVK